MKKMSLLIYIVMLTMAINAQDGLKVKILDDSALPQKINKKSDGSIELQFKKQELTKTFSNYKIDDFYEAYSNFDHPKLQNIYIIKTKELELINELSSKFPNYFEFIRTWTEPKYTYETNDYALELDDQKGLDLVRAIHAWDISKGDADIFVGINDTYIQTDHEDLEDDIYQVITNGSPNGHNAYHGCAVSFCAAGVTNNNKGLSSIGFKSRIIFEHGYDVNDLKALADSGANVVNASYCHCFPDTTDYDYEDSLAIEIIHDMGVIIVAGAGNGPGGTSCGDGHDYCYPASYPHVISVSSVNHLWPYGYDNPEYGERWWVDCHEQIIGDPSSTHTHNDKVDLCAPGFHVHTATDSNRYTAAWGTSLASPIVAGVCALLLAENPDLTPDEIESILKSTAFDVTTIPENEDYDGLLGAGRINAYAALNKARESNVTYESVPYATGFENGVDKNWTFYESHRYGRSVMDTEHSPHSGLSHLTMDVIENNNYNTNEAWLHVNLSGKSNILLQFWLQEYSDETHNQDGVFLSDDGGENFVKVVYA